jgi:hypothetical protein
VWNSKSDSDGDVYRHGDAHSSTFAHGNGDLWNLRHTYRNVRIK